MTSPTTVLVSPRLEQNLPGNPRTNGVAEDFPLTEDSVVTFLVDEGDHGPSPSPSPRGWTGPGGASVAEPRERGQSAETVPPPRQSTHKPRWTFGYLPLKQEIVPPATPDVVANVAAGILMGLKMTLGMVAFAGLVFNTGRVDALYKGFPIGIQLFWVSAIFQLLWNSLFGRIQFSIVTPQDAPALLLSISTARIAQSLHNKGKDGHILPAVLALISFTSALSGLVFILMGKLKTIKTMQMFPVPVMGGFLSVIGIGALRGSLALASGAKFVYLWPEDIADAVNGNPLDTDFFQPDALGQVASQIAMVAVMRNLPAVLKKTFPNIAFMKKLWGLVCILVPLPIFYIVVLAAGIELDRLRSSWLYPTRPKEDFWAMWAATDWSKAELGATLASEIGNILTCTFLSLLSATLGISGILATFPVGPEGDPDPNQPMDMDHEVVCMGAMNVCTGLFGGMMGYHQMGSSINNRLDNGTHRMSGFVAAAFIALVLLSGVPLADYIPKFFLAGIFMNIGWVFVKQWIVDMARQLPPHEYAIILLCDLVFLATGDILYCILFGLGISSVMFLVIASRTNPVRRVVHLKGVRSGAWRPKWEVTALAKLNELIMHVQFEGPLFFGTVDDLLQEMQKALNNIQKMDILIFDFADVTSMDSSAVSAFKRVKQLVDAVDCFVIVCGLEPEEQELLASFLPELHPNLASCTGAVQLAEERVLVKHLYDPLTAGQDVSHLLPELNAAMALEYYNARILSPGPFIYNVSPSVFDHLLDCPGEAQIEELRTACRVVTVGPTARDSQGGGSNSGILLGDVVHSPPGCYETGLNDGMLQQAESEPFMVGPDDRLIIRFGTVFERKQPKGVNLKAADSKGIVGRKALAKMATKGHFDVQTRLTGVKRSTSKVSTKHVVSAVSRLTVLKSAKSLASTSFGDNTVTNDIAAGKSKYFCRWSAREANIDLGNDEYSPGAVLSGSVRLDNLEVCCDGLEVWVLKWEEYLKRKEALAWFDVYERRCLNYMLMRENAKIDDDDF